MNKGRDSNQPWLRRFMERGGLTLVNAVVVFPLICYALRRWTSLDWFYAALVAAVLSIIAAQILLLPIALSLQLVFPALLREVCPACGERQLVLGMTRSKPCGGQGAAFSIHTCHLPSLQATVSLV